MLSSEQTRVCTNAQNSKCPEELDFITARTLQRLMPELKWPIHRQIRKSQSEALHLAESHLPAHIPITSKREAKVSTSFFSSNMVPGGFSFITLLKSTNFLPLVTWMSWATLMALEMNCPTFTKSSSTRPREVMAGVPRRRPLGFNALLSPGTVFLLQTMEACSQTNSALLPFTPFLLRSRRRRWLSVPPDTRSN